MAGGYHAQATTGFGLCWAGMRLETSKNVMRSAGQMELATRINGEAVKYVRRHASSSYS